jgi:hypothetical protein
MISSVYVLLVLAQCVGIIILAGFVASKIIAKSKMDDQGAPDDSQ